MKNQMLYRELAKYYDLIYSWKDYKKEAILVRKLILKYKKSDGNELLDAGCGTGRHLKYLKNYFSCVGIDINKESLQVASKNVKGVAFKQADMANFKLNKKFDAVICLFSSIGYARTYSNLRKTIRNFARHMKKGGVLIVEAWLDKSVFKPGHFHLDTYSGEGIRIARIGVSKRKNGMSLLEMHYLIAEKGKGIKHFADRHELGLFEIKDILNIMADSGLKSKYIKKGLMKDRGIYIGVKIQ